jgi:hypothetical protein
MPPYLFVRVACFFSAAQARPGSGARAAARARGRSHTRARATAPEDACRSVRLSVSSACLPRSMGPNAIRSEGARSTHPREGGREGCGRAEAMLGRDASTHSRAARTCPRGRSRRGARGWSARARAAALPLRAWQGQHSSGPLSPGADVGDGEPSRGAGVGNGEPSRGAGVSAVPVQMWQRPAQSWRRCGGGQRSRGAHVTPRRTCDTTAHAHALPRVCLAACAPTGQSVPPRPA